MVRRKQRRCRDNCWCVAPGAARTRASVAVPHVRDDVRVTGSAVFNVLVIIALSAISSDQALLIDWKPLSRDCFFYSVAIVLLVTFTETDKSVVAYVALLVAPPPSPVLV